jgi:hypothetical protein
MSFPPIEDWDAPERVAVLEVRCVGGCGTMIRYEVREFGPQYASSPMILCDACAERVSRGRE